MLCCVDKSSWPVIKLLFVQVIDSAELLADHAALPELLEAAKNWADRGLIRVVLCTSDDGFVQRLARMHSPIILHMRAHTTLTRTGIHRLFSFARATSKHAKFTQIKCTRS